MTEKWAPQSWRDKEARQLPVYPDAGELARVEETLANYPRPDTPVAGEAHDQGGSLSGLGISDPTVCARLAKKSISTSASRARPVTM